MHGRFARLIRVDLLSVIKSTPKGGGCKAAVYETIELGFPDRRNSHDWGRLSLCALGLAQLL